MALPSESELISAIQQLKSYTELSDEDTQLIVVAASLLGSSGRTSSSTLGGTSNTSSKGGYATTAISTRLPTSGSTATYAANDVYGSTFELVEFGEGSSVILTTIKLLFNIAALPSGMSGFSLFLYSQNPTAIPDNAAFSISSTDKPTLLTPLGIYLNAASLAIGGGLVVIDIDNRNIQIPLTGTSVWGRLVTHGSFMPTSPSETVNITTLTLATADIPQAGYKSSAVSIRANTSGALAAYAANDVYGSTFQLSGIGIPGFAMVTNVSLMFNITTLPVGMGAFLLFLYKNNPILLADNDAFSISVADKTNLLTPTGIYLGIAKTAIGGGLVVLEAPEINRQIELVGTSVWGRLVTINNFTPANPSETVDIIVQTVGI